jgi:hypothetical protein
MHDAQAKDCRDDLRLLAVRFKKQTRIFWGVMAMSVSACTSHYMDHIDRTSEHIGISSTVEVKEESPDRIRLRVEGNSLVPTLDAERVFDETMHRYCETHHEVDQPERVPAVFERRTQLTNTWRGSVFEVIGTFHCVAHLADEPHPRVEPTPSTFPLPPLEVLVPKLPKVPPMPPRKRYRLKLKIKSRKAHKGCHCIKGSEGSLPVLQNVKVNSSQSVPATVVPTQTSKAVNRTLPASTPPANTPAVSKKVIAP